MHGLKWPIHSARIAAWHHIRGREQMDDFATRQLRVFRNALRFEAGFANPVEAFCFFNGRADGVLSIVPPMPALHISSMHD